MVKRLTSKIVSANRQLRLKLAVSRIILRYRLAQQNLRQLTGVLMSVVLGIGGVTLITIATLSQQSAAAATDAGKLISAKVDRPKVNDNLSLAYSKPAELTIPKIKVDAKLTEVGVNPDGSVQVPRGAAVDQPAWYKYSAAPGEKGASVILGHVDTYKSGPSVFFNLGKLRPGDEIEVKRADGLVGVFKVYATRLYQKSAFPTASVYKSYDHAADLNLVTCSGPFNYQADEYSRNTVIYSKLTSVEGLGLKTI